MKSLTKDEARALLDAYEIARKERAAAMPTERDALRVMFDAYQRLEEAWLAFCDLLPERRDDL